MEGLELIDVGLGLILLYLVLSLACTAATEMIAGIVRLRARTLVKGIQNMLHNETLEKEVLNHPLVRPLYRRSRAPSYIPARTFALALTNILVGSGKTQIVGQIKIAVEKIPEDAEIRKSLLILVEEAGDDIASLRKHIEIWYNDTMDRVAGWYKARTQTIAFFLALAIAGILNADTIQIARSLSNDRALREALVGQAEVYAKRDALPVQDSAGAALSAAKVRESIEEVKKLGLPLTWEEAPKDWGWVTKILGILLTTLAMSLGAPFWFDLLKKLVNIRTSGEATQKG